MGLNQPTLQVERAALHSDTSEIPGLFGFSAYEVYQAADVTISTGGLLPHLFTITVLNKFKLRLFVFCGTICLL
jgi:hypothetical protein